MAKLNTPAVKTFKIPEFLGVDESADGDSNIAMGAPSTIRNCRPTRDGGLQKRPGTQIVASLLYNSEISEGAAAILFTETNLSTLTFTMYPTADISTTSGKIVLSGTPETVNLANASSYVSPDYFWTDEYGQVQRFGGVANNIVGGGSVVTGGKVSLSPLQDPSPLLTFTFYPSVSVSTGVVSLSGTPVGVTLEEFQTDYATYTNQYYYDGTHICQMISSAVTTITIGLYTFTDTRFPVPSYVTYLDDNSYEWTFYPQSVVPTTSDSEVRGIWSGKIGDYDLICAACSGKLWALEESYGVWTKFDIGTLNTDNPVYMFGYNEKLYIQNGTTYKYWDGVDYSVRNYSQGKGATVTAGDYYITFDSVNYIFTIPESSESARLTFNESTKDFTFNGSALSHTTGAITTQTDLESLSYSITSDGQFGPIVIFYPTWSLYKTHVYHSIADVAGYSPLIHTARTYDGATTTALETVNMLTGARRVRFSPDGVADHLTFVLPETGIASVVYVKNIATAHTYTLTTEYTISTTNGTVTFISAPSAGISTIEVEYTMTSTAITAARASILAMTRSELYNGQNDNRVLVYGDGSNKVFYSGLEQATGLARADYFPDLNVIHIGDENAPIYDLLRHYDELIAFKDGSAYRIKYGQLTLPSGSLTAAFYVQTINKLLGGSGYGQAQLVNNSPRTLDGRSIYEWVATTSSGGITSDQRNAQPISQKVERTLKTLDMLTIKTFYDKINHEYFAVQDSTAMVQNTDSGKWFIYTDFPAVCMITYKDELYMGTADGCLKHISTTYLHDCGAPIDCYWESGSMDFGAPNLFKSSNILFVQLKPEVNSGISVTVDTDKRTTYAEKSIAYTSATAIPKTSRIKMKVKKFVFEKLYFTSNTSDTTFTITGVEFPISYMGNAK